MRLLRNVSPAMKPAKLAKETLLVIVSLVMIMLMLHLIQELAYAKTDSTLTLIPRLVLHAMQPAQPVLGR
jgi:hypothetical protein